MSAWSSPICAAAIAAAFVACEANAIAQPLPPKRPHSLDRMAAREAVTEVARSEPAPRELEQTTVVAAPARGESVHSLVSLFAQRHGVPETLAHRIVIRESRYNPGVRGRAHYGLMQISLPTARQMGYTGAPQGLLDARTNLAYGMPYLANAWMVSGGSEGRAVALYSRGYYYDAKRQGLVRSLRTARSAPVVDDAGAIAAAQ